MMSWADWKLRIRALISPRRAEEDLDEELRFHLEMQARKHRAAGMAETDAEWRAAREFGGMTQVRERCRDQRGLQLMETIAQDIRYALRGFRKTPGFTITVIATIALGLGLNTAAFTAFDAYVLRPLQVRDPHSLYEALWIQADGNDRRLTWRDLEDCRKNAGAFSESIGYEHLLTRIAGHPVIGQLVSGNYFAMLGGETILGRPLVPDDAPAPGGQPVMVLSYRCWSNKFAADPQIVGQKLFVRGYPLEVVGVAREGFAGVGDIPWDFWVPDTISPLLDTANAGPLGGDRFGDYRFRLVGRLRAGWTPGRTRAALQAWARQHSASRLPAERIVRVDLESRATTIPLVREVVLSMAPLLAAFGLVLAVACANIANLMLARAMARQREIGVRLAIGASRKRLVRQLLSESILLAVPSAIVGFAIAQLTVDGCVRVLYATLPRGIVELITIIPLHPDWRVLLFMLGAAILAALLFGLVPALQATRPNIMQAARGEFTTDYRPTRLRHALVVAQLAVSALILITGAILLRQNLRISGVQPGLDTRGVVWLDVQSALGTGVRRQLAADPLVEQVEASSKVPIAGLLRWIAVTPAGAKQRTPAGYLLASPGYLSLFRVPILRGRNFTDEEARANAPVAVISQATATALFAGRDPIGQKLHIHLDGNQIRGANSPAHSEVTVIGVARDAVNGWIGSGTDATCIYFPTTVDAAGRALLVRVRGDAGAARQRLDSALAQSAPGAINQIQPMDEVLNIQRYPFRVAYWLAGGLGVLTLALTLAGIYGVLSYLVAQRTKEIGIRVALGANYRQVVGIILRQSTRLAAIGIAIGAAGALAVSMLIGSQIPNMEPFDVRAFALGASVVFAASLFAAWTPSMRAARIEPVTTLRCD